MELTNKQQIEIRLLMARIDALKQTYTDEIGQKIECVNYADLKHTIMDYTNVKQLEITKEQFKAYVKVQMSGVTNMLAVSKVSRLSGLSKETIGQIIDNYSELSEKHLTGEVTK